MESNANNTLHFYCEVSTKHIVPKTWERGCNHGSEILVYVTEVGTYFGWCWYDSVIT